MTESLKILVCGDVRGEFKTLFNRVDVVNRKTGPYAMLLSVGEFFNPHDDSEWQEVLSALIKVPVPTYVVGPTAPENKKYITDISGCELAQNITYLGRRGVYTFSSGLTVAYLGGLEKGSDNVSDPDVRFASVDVDKVRLPFTSNKDFKGIDVLLTSQWPSGVEKYGNSVEEHSDVRCSSLVAQLALSLKPRYHFSGLGGISYERPPYRNHRVLQSSAEHVTRFIALANVGNKEKQKYLYAFSIIPLKFVDSVELKKQPKDVTECPYTVDASLVQSETSEEEKAQQFFYDQKSLEKRKRRHNTSHERPQKKTAQPSGPCWFCLGSPEVEKHLVISVGEHCYLALAKGGLTPDHCLIIPIAHHQSTTSAPDDVLTEIDTFKSSLRKYFSSIKKEVVFFERNYKTQHLQIQVVPISRTVCQDLVDTVVGFAVSQNFELAQIPQFSDLKQIVPGGAPYFYIEFPDGEKFLYRIKQGFPIQFGREALALPSVLNMPDRADWRNCKSTKEEEIQMVAEFRGGFKKFDVTLR